MLLAGLDIDFKVFVKPDIEELFPEKLGMLEIPVYLARAKSDHYLDRLNEKTLLITADTIVWYKDKLVGKPETAEEAVQILSDLSGNMHEVVTGVCLRSRKNIRIFYSHSKVSAISPKKRSLTMLMHINRLIRQVLMGSRNG